MPVPEFVAALRAKVGHDKLWLPTADALIIDGERVLLVLHGDHQEWMLPGGHVEPGEHPEVACVRETLEETGITVDPERLVAVTVSPLVTYPNGDMAQHLELTFACRVVSGDTHVNDPEELSQVTWFRLDQVPLVSDRVAAIIGHVASGAGDVLTV